MRSSIGVSRELLRRLEALEQVVRTDTRAMIAALTDEELDVALLLETEDERQRFVFDADCRMRMCEAFRLNSSETV